MILRAPFPWFGGKAPVADEVWSRLGDVPNYVEPFAGSLAVLLSRPHAPKTETVNDKDAFLANFWRAVKGDPEAVAHHADWPVNEADLHARHWWLLTEGAPRIARLNGTPDGYDAEVAGRWVWGACAWIGSGWCSGEGPWQWTGEAWRGINRQLPHLSGGQGINRKLPHLSGGRGINRQLPHVGDGGRGEFILDWMMGLAERLRHVRVACGEWHRVVGPSVTTNHGMTAVFLDPPYGAAADRHEGVYACDDLDVARAAREWAVTNGNDPLLRIAFAGYQGEHEFPDDWEVVRWKAKGGYGSQGNERGRANAGRETLWFSPHCLRPHRNKSLLDLMGDAA